MIRCYQGATKLLQIITNRHTSFNKRVIFYILDIIYYFIVYSSMNFSTGYNMIWSVFVRRVQPWCIPNITNSFSQFLKKTLEKFLLKIIDFYYFLNNFSQKPLMQKLVLWTNSSPVLVREMLQNIETKTFMNTLIHCIKKIPWFLKQERLIKT